MPFPCRSYQLSWMTAAIVSGLAAHSVIAAPNISALLMQLSPEAEVFYRDGANWTETIQRYNVFAEPTFFAAIRPANAEDVQNVVRYAAHENISFLAQGRGHGFSTSFGALQNGLSIDLGAFTDISVDAAANTMTIGGGVKFGDVFDPLYAEGKEIQTGSCSCVGMLGASLGGGVGRYQGIHGLIIDALQSVKMVTATGDLITVSKTEEPDLFWGLRGAGFNFGIMLEATYGIHDLTNGGSVLNADFKFHPSDNQTYFEIMQSFGSNLPAELSLYTIVNIDEDYGPTITLSAVYVGPEDTGLDLLKPFLDLPYYERNITQTTWNKVVSTSVFGLDSLWCIKGASLHMWSIGVKQLDVPTHVAQFNSWVDFIAENPGLNASSYWIEFFPTEAVQAVSDNETAYPHRDIAAHMMVTMNYADEKLAQTAADYATSAISAYNATSGFQSLHTYVSYARGTEGLDVMYGKEKLPRLLDLKKKWDPQALFSFNNPLPVS